MWIVENRGYDIGPFFYFLHHINLSDYDLIIKLHSKGNMPKGELGVCNRYMGKTWWRTLLWSAVLGSREQVEQNIRIFVDDPSVGMLGSEYLVGNVRDNSKGTMDGLVDACARMGIEYVSNFSFIAGTIFMARASIMQPLKDKYDIIFLSLRPNRETMVLWHTQWSVCLAW